MYICTRKFTDGMLCCYCAVTHGHIDHVGALEALVKEYPEVQALFHEAEAPFLTGVQYFVCTSAWQQHAVATETTNLPSK